jgi:hypothetical protein
MPMPRPKGLRAMLAALPFVGQRYAWVDFAASSSSDDEVQDLSVVLDAPLQESNIITSLMDIPGEQLEDPMHRPVIDIDKSVTVIPSTTSGHSHLYINHMMPWSDYVKLLEVLVEIGVVEPGYLNASLARGYTALRLPWVSKHEVVMEEAG